jgi:hypothetical protein
VEVRDHKVGVAQLPVERGSREHDAGQSGDQELEEEADAEHHRSREDDLAAPDRRQPVEDLDPVGTEITIVAKTKNVLPAGPCRR